MTIATAAFGRALRRLDAPDARQFLADLLAARGYRTAVEGRVVTAESPAGGTTRLLVVAGAGSLAAAGRGAAVDTVVSTGGPVADAVAGLVVRLAARRGDAPVRIGPETLREWLVYALGEDEREALTEQYLGATEPTALGRLGGALADLAAWAGGAAPPDRPARRAAAAVALAVVVVAAVVVAGALGPVAPVNLADDAGDGAGTATGTPAGAATAASPDATAATAATPTTPVQVGTGGAEILPEACPVAPIGAHPATLRPTVLQTVSADGLEGWELIATQNLTRFEFDPNDQQAGVVPEIRHIAVYESPAGTQYRLGIDRWESTSRSRAVLTDDGPWNAVFPWGTYTVWVEWGTGESGRPAALRLLGAVTTAEGIKLGGECVTALLDGEGASDTDADADAGPGTGPGTGTEAGTATPAG